MLVVGKDRSSGISWLRVAGGGSLGETDDCVAGEFAEGCWRVEDLEIGAGGKALRVVSAEGEAEVLNPRRLEFARRAIAMFSAERKEGERGEADREFSLEVLISVRFLVCRGGGLLYFRGVGLVLVAGAPKVAIAPRLGVSFTIGEYCDMGEAPLYAPGGGAAILPGGGARLD